MAEVKVNLHYPNSDEYEYTTELKRINLDEERKKDIMNGNGFIITSPKAIKNDLKEPNGIFSPKYGQTLQDMNPFINRYSCKCGHYQSRFYHGLICPICKTQVKYVGDNFEYFGYIVLKPPYYAIHMVMFWQLTFFIGEKEFNNIIMPYDPKDADGNDAVREIPKDEPYFGIGPIGFYEKFDEIMEYYKVKRKIKIEYYDSIMKDRDKVFTSSIPVYTTHLRPFRLEGGEFHFEGTNAIYTLMARLASEINKDELEMNKKRKPKNQLLYDLQMKWKELDKEISKILAGKKGTLRSLFGGRYNFTARSVIVPSPDLKIDEITLGYPCLCGLLQQVIINILHKMYNMEYNRAYQRLQESLLKPDPLIMNIIKGYIRDSGRGIPTIINRNPTISYGSLLQMYCVGVTETYTMALPLQVCPGMGADFDK